MYLHVWFCCGSGVQPASHYQKVAGSISPDLHVIVSLGKLLNPKLLSVKSQGDQFYKAL